MIKILMWALALRAANFNRRAAESQNQRMAGVGRDLCGSPSPTPGRSRVTQSRLHRTVSRWVLNISREGEYHLQRRRISSPEKENIISREGE